MEFDLTSGMAVLERTPAALRAMLSGLPPAWTDATEGPDTWSPFVVIAHLIHAERTDWIPRATVILDQGPDRRFPPFDRLPPLDAINDKSIDVLVDEFAATRAESLETLRAWNLTEEDLGLEGEHPSFGPVTLRQLLSTWVAHDLGHTVQIARVMAKQYRDAVGPWRAYLSVMDR